MTDRIPLNDMTSDQLDQLHDEIGRLQITNRALNTAVVEAVERAERAEAEARAWAEAESADIAAGSYAGRVQELEAELAALRAVARGYCPACGRGDAAPTVTDWEQQRKRADEAEQQRDRYKTAWYSARNGRESRRHELAVAGVAYEHADQQYVQQRQRADQAEELLSIAHDTSNRAETERARAVQHAEQAQYRLRLAHQARRAKEQQLDGIRRALCDVGAIQDDDPYSHADLEDVIRQAFPPPTLAAATQATDRSCSAATPETEPNNQEPATTDGWRRNKDGTWTLPVDGGSILFTQRSTPESRAQFAAEWKRRHKPDQDSTDTPRLSVRLAWLGAGKEALLEAEHQQRAEAAVLSRADEDEAADVYEEMLRRVESSGPRPAAPGVTHPDTGAGFASSTNWTTVEPAGLPAWIRNGAHDLRFSWQPSEHCGHLSPQLFTSPPTECVLRPGHSGTHANDSGGRWWIDPTAELAGQRRMIADALREHGMVHLGDQVPADEYDCCADAVLAVLNPRPADA